LAYIEDKVHYYKSSIESRMADRKILPGESKPLPLGSRFMDSKLIIEEDKIRTKLK